MGREAKMGLARFTLGDHTHGASRLPKQPKTTVLQSIYLISGETGADLEMKVGRFRLKLVHKVVMWTYFICQIFRFDDHFLAEFWISASQEASGVPRG